MSKRPFSIIITEKLGMARKVACALCPAHPCKERQCPCYHSDLFVHHLARTDKKNHPVRLLRCRLASLSKDKWRSYWNDNNIDWSRVSLIHADSAHGPGGRHVARSLRQVLSSGDGSSSPNAIMERVDWYTIRSGHLGRDWLVLHTGGNPQRVDMSRSMPSKPGGTPTVPAHPRQLLTAMRRLPLHSRKRSTRMRLSHIRWMLRLGRKAGTNVYVATDLDTAGSFLVSALPGFRAMAEVNKPLRVGLNDTTVTGVKEAIRNAGEFDWHNAEAGRLRDAMDYVIGGALNHLVRQSPDGTKQHRSFSVGRTRLLALDCLCRRCAEIDLANVQGAVFLLFPGVGDRAAIEQHLHDGSAVAVSAELLRGPYSPAGFLRELLRWNVGTVATRYKLIGSLLHQGLIQQHGPWLSPSPKAMAVEEHLLGLLEGPDFSLWQWHERMTEFLASADERAEMDRPELEEQVDGFLLEFLTSFRAVLASAGPAIQRFQEALNALPDQELAGQPAEDEEVSDSSDDDGDTDELGLEGPVPLDDLMPYVNVKKNSLAARKNARVSRRQPQPEYDWAGMLRRHLLLEREVTFRPVDSANLGRLLEFEDVPCTLFRADCDLRKLPKSLRRITGGKAKIDKPVTLEIDSSAGRSGTTGAHGPLQIFGPRPADMGGPMALVVAKEYMRPCEHALSLLDATESGLELLDSFGCGKLEFHRSDSFAFATAHTLDTLLATMYDRYGMPFETTADIAESLYLGGSAY